MEIIKGNLYIANSGKVVRATTNGIVRTGGGNEVFEGEVVLAVDSHPVGHKTNMWDYNSFLPYTGELTFESNYEIY